MSFVADLHLHSSYAYATSSALTLDNLALWARLKGIDLLATADFTHPLWLQQLKDTLHTAHDGAYSYNGVNFVMGTEVSCVFRQDGPRPQGSPPHLRPRHCHGRSLDDGVREVRQPAVRRPGQPSPSQPGTRPA